MRGVVPHENARRRLNRVLFPDLAAALDTASARHDGSDRATAEFDRILDLRAAERFAGAGLGPLMGTIGGAKLATDLAAAGRAVSSAEAVGVPLVLPEFEEFSLSGSDLSVFAAALEGDPDLTAVPAPYGLGVDQWSAALLAAASAADSASPFSSTADGPLLLSSEVRREFAILSGEPPPGTPTVRGSASTTRTGGGRVVWTLRLLPATPAPPILGLNHVHGGPHATLPELLMLQLMRTAIGLPPLDGGDGRASFTWLAGELAGGRLAARHVYDDRERVIRITAREIGSQGPHLGSRRPIG